MQKGTETRHPPRNRLHSISHAIMHAATCLAHRITCQRQLRLSAGQYRSLLESADASISMIDFGGRYLFVNQFAARPFARPAREIVGKTVFDLFSPVDAGYILRDVREVIQHNAGKNLEPELLVAGEHRAFRTSIQPVCDRSGTPVAAMIYASEITEQKRADAALRASEQRYRQLADSITDYFVAVDRELRYTYWNKACESLTGITMEEALGKTMEDIFPSVREWGLNQRLAEVLKTGRGGTIEYRLPTEDGEIDFEVSVYPSPEGLSILGRDITDHKRVQRQAFEIALEKERVHLLSLFVQNASHELRTPLAALNTNFYLMSRATDEAKRKELAIRGEEQIFRITRLLDSIMSMTRLDSAVPFSFRPVDVNRLLQQMLEVADKHFRKKHIQVYFLPNPGLPMLQADADWLQEAFERLLDNAARFTPEGGTVYVHTFARGGDAVFEIRDSGPGIPDKDLPHVFERFWRSDEMHTTPGFGLGLPIARLIIARHGGTLHIESKPDKGTVVRVVLPMETLSQE